MLLWTLQISVISIIFIFLIHHLITFFKSTLTVPKVKDLVNSPAQKYETMYNVISSKPQQMHAELKDDLKYKESLLPQPVLGKPEMDSMKSELKNFLKDKMNASASSTPLDTLDTLDSFGTLSYQTLS